MLLDRLAQAPGQAPAAGCRLGYDGAEGDERMLMSEQ